MTRRGQSADALDLPSMPLPPELPPDGDQTDGRPGVDPTSGSVAPVPGRSSLAAALVALQADLPRIHKDRTAEVEGETKAGRPFKYKYSFADLTDVTEALMPLLSKHGLAFAAFPTLAADGKFVLRYHLLHESGDRETGEYPLPTGGTPQALGSAITYGRRYCLCSVTGVAPDDDDDAAAASSAQASEDQRQRPLPRAVVEARKNIQAAWRVHYGEFNEAQATDLFGRWSGGEILREAPASRLQAFAAYLTDLPRSDAGGDPAESPTGRPEDVDNEPRRLTGLQRSRIFAELNSRGIRDAAEQRTYIGEVIGRPIKSRTEITFADAQQLIDHFELLGKPPGKDENEAGS